MTRRNDHLTATQREALNAALGGPLLQRSGSWVRPKVGFWLDQTVRRLVANGLMRITASSRGLSIAVLTPYGTAVARGERPYTGPGVILTAVQPATDRPSLADRIAP